MSGAILAPKAPNYKGWQRVKAIYDPETRRWYSPQGYANLTARRRHREGGPAIHIFKPLWAENVASKPLYVRSKQEYREVCKRNGKLCRGLL